MIILSITCRIHCKNVIFNVIFLIPQVRFLSDLVNCHVIAAPSMVAMFENFISVTQEEDVPQVDQQHSISLHWYPLGHGAHSGGLFEEGPSKPQGFVVLKECGVDYSTRDTSFGGMVSWSGGLES